MRRNTTMVARFDNIGNPSESETVEGDMLAVAKGLVLWLSKVSMNNYFRITIGRNHRHLEQMLSSHARTRLGAEADLNDILGDLISGIDDSDFVPDES